MARRGKAGNSAIGWLVLFVLALLASVPKEVWIGLAIFAVVGGVIYGISKLAGSNKPTAPMKPPTPKESTFSRQASALEPEWMPSLVSKPSSEFRIPSAPKSFAAGAWIPAGSDYEVAGLSIRGGMVYLGTSLKTPAGHNDPCLIDPFKKVALHGDYTERQMGYWPSYSEISPGARRAYLNWLADGRKDPQADIGYVFLFFYGLERRAVIEAAADQAVRADCPTICAELERLLGIYAEKSDSFRRYAGELLDWLALDGWKGDLYKQPIPGFRKTYELPLYIRLALGQAAVAGVPVPAHLALAWMRLDPGTPLRTPAVRCPEQFNELFTSKYNEAFGAGIVLPRNRTKLKCVYRPASSGVASYGEIGLSFGDIPDVTVLTGPVKKLQPMVEAATKDLEAYSRFVGRNPDAKQALEGLLQLPATLWPPSAQKALNDLKNRMGGGMVTLTFQGLLSTLEASAALTKERTLALARAFESMNIGIEPDVLSGARLPKAEDAVVLFSVPPGEAVSRSTPNYLLAVLTLQLASAVAAADGDFSAAEMNHLREQVQSWTHLTPNHIRRLLAHLRLLTSAPASPASLKKKLEPLDASAKETIAAFMTTVAQSDGTVSPDEVRMLEKIYKLLGVEPKKVFSDVHAVAAGTKITTTAASKIESAGFKLDPARIAELQRDSEKVSVLLANIFKEEEAVVQVEIPETEAEEALASSGLLGLDEVHANFARMLLSRPQWRRAELQDVASDLDLMLDGALERINEASFDAHDAPFFEGEDPVTVNLEVLEKIEA